MIPAHDVTGVVLAGGMSTRMGRDKALLMLEGKPFIQHMAETLRAVFPEVLISANTSAYDSLGMPTISDLHRNCGPLGGIHAALSVVRTPYIFVAPCDSPLLLPVMIQRILEAASPDRPTIATTAESSQPLIGVYPRSSLSMLEAFLGSGNRKVAAFVEAIPCSTVTFYEDGYRLANINTPVDYQNLG